MVQWKQHLDKEWGGSSQVGVGVEGKATLWSSGAGKNQPNGVGVESPTARCSRIQLWIRFPDEPCFFSPLSVKKQLKFKVTKDSLSKSKIFN